MEPEDGRAHDPAERGQPCHPEPAKRGEGPPPDLPAASGSFADLRASGAPAAQDDNRHPEANAPWQTEPPSAVLKRIKRTAAAAYLVFVPISLYLAGFRGFLGLTCSAAVTIIAFLWLEEIVEVVLQPTPKLHAWRVTLRTLTRFALLVVAITVTIIVARFNVVSVLMGFSIIVVGIFGEALYSLYRGFAH